MHVIHVPLKVDGIYSNLLHRAWVCHTCDLSSACPGFHTHDDVPRADAATLTREAFVRDFERPNRPVVITRAAELAGWRALEAWSPEHLAGVGGDQTFRATSATAPVAATFTLREYFRYASQTREEAPLYLFERDFCRAAPSLGSDYSVPSFFAPEQQPQQEEQHQPEQRHHADLFRLLGETARPDYRWLIAGPARSGSIFHIDPNQTNAWNVSVRGRKKWIFYPPGVPPPGVVADAAGAEVTVPISTGEWLLSFWSAHLECRRRPDPALRPLETIALPGELVFVPHGYWHMVVNLDDCIALTHNYVSSSNLADCLRFLRDTPDQISGVRDRGSEAVQPDELYRQFLQCLGDELAPADLERAVEASQRREGGGSSGEAKGEQRLFELHELQARGRRLRRAGRGGQLARAAAIEQAAPDEPFSFSFSFSIPQDVNVEMPVQEVPSDWRGPLFFWRGQVVRGEDRTFSWCGDWATDMRDAGQGGPNSFACTLTLASDNNFYTNTDFMLMAETPTKAAISSSYLLDQGDGLGLQTFLDHSHDVIVGPAQGRRWAAVAGCGSTEFGRFVTHGRLSVDGPATTLLLARRYIRDSDSRAKLSPAQLLAEASLTLPETPEAMTDDAAIALLPWRLVAKEVKGR